jgi:hypothetical protein
MEQVTPELVKLIGVAKLPVGCEALRVRKIVEKKVVFTFWDCKEANKANGISMCTSSTVMHTAIRNIRWVILILTCSHRDSCLVAAQDDGNK